MPDRLHVFNFIPFLLSAAPGFVPTAKVNMTRIIEAVIIAMLTAGVVTWRTTEVLTVKLEALEKRTLLKEDEELRRYAGITARLNDVSGEVRENRDVLEEHILEQIKSNAHVRKSLDKTIKWGF